jgi:regulator of RNase E activity RraA
VAIYPGDVIVGDAEGIVCIPAHLVEEVAAEAAANADYEVFVAAHLRRGRSIFGLFPATPESRSEYDQWVAAGRPSLESLP